MATTSIWKIGSNLYNTVEYAKNKEKTNKDYFFKDLDSAIDYASNKDKTEESYYVSGINCEPKYAYVEMMQTKKAFNKANGILGYHGYQSFNEGEVTPDVAHEIGLKLADEMWGDRFEVLVTTHLNTKHLHNHFIVNSVSFVDGNKYYNTIKNYAEFRRLNDEICKEYGLNVLEEKITKGTSIDYKKYQNASGYYKTAKRDIDLAIIEATSYKDFENILSNMGYEIIYRAGKLSIRGKDYRRNIRVERYFGSDYSFENINRRIFTTHKKTNNFKKEKIKYHGFIGLYKYYCYLLKIYPKTVRNYKISSSMKKDLENLELINKQTILLVEKNIDTKEDLYTFVNNEIKELEDCIDNKSKLWNELKKSNDNLEYEKLKAEIDKLSQRIRDIKFELKLCDGIEKRVGDIEDSVKNYEIAERKEGRVYESIK